MKDVSMKKFINCIAYFAVAFIGVALTISYIFKGTLAQVASILTTIANAFAYFIAAIYGFYFARSKRNIWWTIIYIVAVILIAIFMILPLFI